MGIKIIGLGPGDKSQISYGAIEALKSGNKIYLRTENHPVVNDLDICYESFDILYEGADKFENVYGEIAKKIVEIGKDEDIVYAVPGHPRVAETSVTYIENLSKEEGVSVEVVASMSFVDAMYAFLGFDPSEGFRLLDSFSIRKKDLDTDVNIIITQVYDRFIASNIKIELMNYYADDQDVWIVRAAGVKGMEFKDKIKLYELDRQEMEFDHLTSIFIPKGGEKNFKDIMDLVEVTRVLRGDNGCEWDKKQTHKTLTKYLIEECYELIDAIENDDIDGIVEELGDLQYHIVLHSQIGYDTGYFDYDEVCNSSVEKMVSRHPHVFGDEEYEEGRWNINKMNEKGETKVSEGMRRIPNHLPALMKAIKVQNKASDAGFDWKEIDSVFEKVREEYEEFIEEYNRCDHEKMTEEFGDLIFSIVKLGRFLNIDPEHALCMTINKFVNRFEFVEDSLINNGLKIDETNLETLEKLWEESKKRIKNT